MRRWNGWGDDAVDAHPPPALLQLLGERLGPGRPARDITLGEACSAVPPSRLPPHPLVETASESRVRHCRGQSLPDLVALRTGMGLVFPDGVAFPSRDEDVHGLLAFASACGAVVVPFGGGTSVVGHVNPVPGERPVLTIDLARLAGLRAFDETSRLATFGAGSNGPAVEAALSARGYTLGHFPQSFEHSTLGGWIATRSSGQQSRGYGRIEDLFAGGTLVAPAGQLDLPPFPASAAGPDLRQVVLGSEGRMGIVTEAIVRVAPRPEVDRFEAAFFPSWPSAFAGARALAQSGLAISLLRVSSPEETATTLALGARGRAAAAMDLLLRIRRLPAATRCLGLFGVSGPVRRCGQALAEARAILRRHGAIVMGRRIGESWRRGRFRAPYLRNALWERGYAVDTVETAAPWSRVPATLEAVETALRGALGDERVHAFTHLSHVYATGASVYTTFAFRTAADPASTLDRWRALKGAASAAIVDAGATISHQHGVGEDHAPHLAAEKGELGMRALERLLPAFDAGGLMNPGKLIARRGGS